MSDKTMTYHGVTRAHFNMIFAKIKEEGVDIPQADTGTFESHGVTIQWAYDEASSTLTLECLKKPFYVPMGMLDEKFDDLYVETDPRTPGNSIIKD